jgi:molecular chaperone DnaK
MVHDAETHSDEDSQRRKRVEARNRLDQLVYATEKTLGEHKEKLGATDVGDLEGAIGEAKEALESDDLERMEAASAKLTQASHKLAEIMYKEQAAGAEEPADGGSAAESKDDDDEVIDAEYVDVDESKS